MGSRPTFRSCSCKTGRTSRARSSIRSIWPPARRRRWGRAAGSKLTMGGHSGFAVLGPINTAVADAAVGYGNEKHVPFIVNVSTGAKVNELFAQSPQNYVFRLAANDVVQTELVVRQAIDVRLHRSPAILCDDTGYGKSGLETLLAALGRRGIKPVYVGSFKLKDTDMTSQLRAARAAGADVLFSYGIGPELAAVALSMQRVGWSVDFLGSWTLGMEVFRKIAGPAAEGATMPQTFIEAWA